MSSAARLAMTQSMPHRTVEVLPVPSSSRTLTATIRRAGRDADDAGAVVLRGDRAGDVRAVAVDVVGRAPVRRAVGAGGDVEVGVLEVDAGVEDGHGARSRPGGRCSAGAWIDAADAGRDRAAGLARSTAASLRTGRSATIAATSGSARSSRSCSGVSSAAKPFERAAVACARRRCRGRRSRSAVSVADACGPSVRVDDDLAAVRGGRATRTRAG